MTVDEFIECFRYSTSVGFTFSESQQIANYLEELKVIRKALELDSDNEFSSQTANDFEYWYAFYTSKARRS